MIKGIVKRVLKHLETRRKWNRTKRWMAQHNTTKLWMAQHAESRLIISLYATGALRRRA